MDRPIFQRGIDVSRYQGSIDWPRVARDGRQFVIARCVSSDNSGVYVDPTFNVNYTGARAAGMRVGAYYFTYARTTAYADAELRALFTALSGKQFEYPVFVDVEAKQLTSLGKRRLTDMVLYALERITTEGYYAGVYTYSEYANVYLDMARLRDYPLWLADYNRIVSYPGDYDMLQYSGSGRLDGIDTSVDLDVSYMDFLPTIMQRGMNNYPSASAPVSMLPTPNLSLEVYGTKNCQYFYTPNVYDIAGTLPVGRYPAVAQSEGCYNGWSWVTLRYRGGVYWTALLADRCYLVRN